MAVLFCGRLPYSKQICLPLYREKVAVIVRATHPLTIGFPNGTWPAKTLCNCFSRYMELPSARNFAAEKQMW
jgi:hypothetical protein